MSVNIDINDFDSKLQELMKEINVLKECLVRYLKKHFKKNIHYITYVNDNIDKIEKRGGHNRDDYLLTENTYNLIKNTYNLRNNDIINITENVQCVNILLTLEASTIGFIFNTFNGIFDIKRQFYFGSYRVDLYFPQHKLVIECDENNHKDRDPIYENKREDYILSFENILIQYNPNDNNFNLSRVLNEINKIIYKKEIRTNKIIIDFTPR